MSNAKLTEQTEAIERLRQWVKPGDTVYCVLRHVSKSGMSRVIDLNVFDKETGDVSHIGYNAALALGYGYDRKREGIKIGGCGMDMGFALVYELSRKLFAGTLDAEGKDPGYLLNHRWL